MYAKKFLFKTIFLSEIILIAIFVFYLFSDIIRPDYLKYSEINSAMWKNACEKFRKMPNDAGEIIFAGSSLTSFFDLSVFENKKIKNHGIGGDFTTGVLLRIDEMIESNPAKIFIEIGINDILAKISQDEILENYTKIVSVIKEKSPQTKIYVQSILPVLLENTIFISNEKANNVIMNVNKKLQMLCSEKQVAYVDLYSSFARNGSLNPAYSFDGVHLTERGYEKWKLLIENFVNE